MNLNETRKSVKNGAACKRSWDDVNNDSTGVIEIDDDSDSCASENQITKSTGKDLRYTRMTNDLKPPSEVRSANSLAASSTRRPFGEKVCSEMTQSERKRYREKKRRSAITNAVDNLSNVLLKVDRNSLIDKNGTPFSYESSLNRTGTINRAARVLQTLHEENEERRVQVTKLTALLREVSNGSVHFERPRQKTSFSQCLSALLNSGQQQLPQPVPFTSQTGLSLQPLVQNEVPLSISRSTIDNLLVLQRQSLEDKLRRGVVLDGQVPGWIQYTAADGVGATSGGQRKVFINSTGTPPHTPSQAMR